MANLKISQLNDGTPVQSADQIPVNRAGTNFRVNGIAPLASPSFTGAPTAPTATALDNSTKIATTAYVDTAQKYVLAALPTLTGVAVTPVPVTALAATDNDLYTVPVGKRAIIVGASYNSSGSSVTLIIQVKISGTYYRLAANIVNTTLTNSILSTGHLILEAGDTYSINASATGVNANLTVYTFDSTNPWKSARIISFVSGDNTVYTCPAGKVAYLAAAAAYGLVSTASMSTSPFVANMTGGNVNYIWNIVPSGGSPGVSNKMAQNLTVATGAVAVMGTTVNPFSLSAGDFLSLNSNSTGQQIAWVNVFEK